MEGNFSQFVKQFRGDFKVFKQNVMLAGINDDTKQSKK